MNDSRVLHNWLVGELRFIAADGEGFEEEFDEEVSRSFVSIGLAEHLSTDIHIWWDSNRIVIFGITRGTMCHCFESIDSLEDVPRIPEIVQQHHRRHKTRKS